MSRRFAAGLLALPALLAAAPALAAGAAPTMLKLTSGGVALPAEPVLGQPHPWEIGLQAAYSPVKQGMIDLNTMVLWIIIAITLFVG
ncbi:MAG: cytochrome c oxidase subunit II, partial [Rhodospirillales bacterium]|nr:cytochrome c oxidase subunit II [Rhodospirillales bacterium]